MDGAYLRDEAVRDRVRAAEEFLDPSTISGVTLLYPSNSMQMTIKHEATDQISF
jgi:hypothetical protein